MRFTAAQAAQKIPFLLGLGAALFTAAQAAQKFTDIASWA